MASAANTCAGSIETGTATCGVLAHASIHTPTSNGIRTSPFIAEYSLKHILGTTPPPPAPNVAALEEAEPLENATIRELLEVIATNPNAAAAMQNRPLGFALETMTPSAAGVPMKNNWSTGNSSRPTQSMLQAPCQMA